MDLLEKIGKLIAKFAIKGSIYTMVQNVLEIIVDVLL